MAWSDDYYNTIAYALDNQMLNGSSVLNTGSIMAYSQKVSLMASKKFSATLTVEMNDVDKRDNGVTFNLLTVTLGADTLADLLDKSHGHLVLVSEK